MIAGVTTMIGFAALLISDVPAVFEIGAFSILGVASVTLLSLSAAAGGAGLAAASARGARAAGAGRGRVPPRSRSCAAASGAAFACARPGLVIGGFGTATLLALLALPRIVIDTDYLSFFDADSEVRRDFDRINARCSPARCLSTSCCAARRRAPSASRRCCARSRNWSVASKPCRVSGARCPCSRACARLNRAIERGIPAEERIPDSREAVAELLFMFPKGDLLRFSTIDQSALNVVVRTGEVGSAAMRELTRRIEAELAAGVLPDLDRCEPSRVTRFCSTAPRTASRAASRARWRWRRSRSSCCSRWGCAPCAWAWWRCCRTSCRF